MVPRGRARPAPGNFRRTRGADAAYDRALTREPVPGPSYREARCPVAKGQVKQSKHNKPKLTVKEKFAKKAAKKAAKMK